MTSKRYIDKTNEKKNGSIKLSFIFILAVKAARSESQFKSHIIQIFSSINSYFLFLNL